MSLLDDPSGAVADALPDVDEVLGPPPNGSSGAGGGDLPSTDDVLPPHAHVESTLPPPTGDVVADWFAQRPAARLLDALGFGERNNGGAALALTPEAQAELDDFGLAGDFDKAHESVVRVQHQALLQPAASRFDVAARTPNSGLQINVAQALADAGLPMLARSVNALNGAFFGSPYPPTPSDDEFVQALGLNVLGAGEAGHNGTAAQTAAPDAARTRFTPTQNATPPAPPSAVAPVQNAAATPPAQTPPPPDIDARARQIAPGIFEKYDALTQRIHTLSASLDDLAQKRDQAATADLDQQIAALQPQARRRIG